VRDFLEENVSHVYRFAHRLTNDSGRAEDLAQEVFLRAWKRRAQLKDRRAARVWLFQIAVNLWRDTLRRPDLKVTRDAGTLNEVEGQTPSPETTAAHREQLESALDAMKALPQRQREVLHLGAVEQLSIDEIARVLDISSSNVKANLSLARKKMRARLRDAPENGGSDDD